MFCRKCFKPFMAAITCLVLAPTPDGLWHEDDWAVSVTETEAETETEMSREIDSDLFNVAHLMMGEAGYTDSTERRLTASVLLNRVDSPLFPDTIGGCLYQPGQYSTVRDGGPFWWEPTADCWQDAEDLLTKWYETGETDLPENVLYQSLFPQGSGTYIISSWGQYFCYQ